MKTLLQLNREMTGFMNSQFSHKLNPIHTWVFMVALTVVMLAMPIKTWSQTASWNYGTQTETLGTTYSWIDCSAGTTIVTGDDNQASFSWPFNFNFYDNSYTTANSLSVATNGFIRLDGIADGSNYRSASSYKIKSNAITFGQIISMAMYDGKVGDNGGWVKYLVTGSEPNRILTIEYNNLEIDYNDGVYADVQVSFYETINKLVLKLGDDNIGRNGVDMGIHSGVNEYYNKWQEVKSGTNNTWIEYTLPSIEVTATIGTLHRYYPTLKDAFDGINDGIQQGEITILINGSIVETASAKLNASGNGSANYSSVNIYPTTSGLSVSGNIPAPLIDLSGADHVIIDGRVNASGATKDLSIINTSTASYGGNSAIRFVNGASDNTVKYCTIKSSESRSNYGIVFFSSSNSSSGNSNNIIDNNDITNAGNRPVNAIYSVGTNGKGNNGNIISNNNIYDFLKHASASRGISLNANTTEWTIDGNSFYETTVFAPTGTVTYEVIKIDNESAGGFIVSNNYIGGSAPQCGGTVWTKNNNNKNLFNAIYLNVGTAVASSLQNNTIQNINWSNSGIATWTGINVNKGSVDIGTVTGNTIGSTTGTNSISVTGGSNGQYIYAMYLAGTGVINCKNNSIGSITSLTASTYGTYIYGIGLSGSVVATIENNTIGSTTTTNSIYASSASTANTQKVYGIYSKSTGTTLIHENTISNLRNNTSNTAVGTRGFIYGIYLTYGTNTVSNNTIRDISIENANTSTYSPSIAGINLITNATNAQSIHDNLIYNISNTSSSFTGCVIGIFSRNPVGSIAGNISGNLVHSLSVDGASTGAKVYGIYENTDGIVYSNNIITLGGSTSTEMYGIYDVGNSGKTGSFFFNSIYISGTNSGSEKSSALRYNTNSNTRDLRNNILFNARSGGSGGHYAIYYDATGGTFTADYNDYYVSGTGGVIGYFGGDKTTLGDMQTATSQDTYSLNTNPNFTTPGGTNSSDYVASAILQGVSGTGITSDYDGTTRNSTPKMGALESALSFVWQGNTSPDFATATNWQNGVVPTNGADISFAETPINHCVLDINRTLKSITNAQSSKILVVNGKELTITGNLVFSNGAQIDATASSSVVIFAGTEAQSIPSGAFVSSTIDALTLNNEHGLTQNGDLILPTAFTLTSGELTIGANTLTINGAISTSSGTLTGGGTSNIIVAGIGASTTLPTISLNNLTLNRANGISLGGDVSVAGTLALTAGTITLGANKLTISGNAPTRVSGNIDASNSSATIELTNSTNITCPESIFVSSINNLTINGAGLSACCSCTINGILNLQSANPSSIMGTLDMGSNTLSLGENATVIGIGDVTGIVKREHTFTSNVEYAFGNYYTTFTFVDANTKPTWICVKTSIGSVPSWDPWDPSPDGKVKRLYQVSCSDNSSTSQATINMRYLVSELDATFYDESKLVFWHKKVGYEGSLPHEHGKSNQDIANHFIGVSGLSFGAAATTNLDDSQIGIAYSVAVKNTWKGEVAGYETEWEQAQNWTAGTVPLSTEDILIPGGLTYYPSLTASANAVAKSIEIEIGASITANSYDITVSGSGGAWINNGTFFPGTGNVLFNHGVSTEIVTVAGITNFYDVEIGANTTLEPVSGCIFRIAGTATGNPSTSKANWAVANSTVEWNGADQTINNPVGLSGSSGYYKLILSGSGTKTMPTTALNITDEFKLSGTVTATAQAPITVGVELEILEDATFATGNYDHTVGGAFDNRGTFIASSGTTITLNGTSTQDIYGGSPTTFENLTIDNTSGVTISTDVTVNDALTLTAGELVVGETELTINASLTKTAGFLDVNTLSSLYFGGTAALSIPANLFTTTPVINNLTINRSGGLIFGIDLTVNGELYLQSTNPSSVKGSLDMGSNTLNMGSLATTTGTGDVTGIVRRSTFVANTEYTFGNQFTSVTFPDVGVLPSEMSVKISIGSVPSWKTEAVKRVYDVIQTGGSGTEAVLKAHYLDSELNGTIESKIVDWAYRYSTTTLTENGRSSSNLTDNWIALAGADVAFFSSSFGAVELSLSASELVSLLWNGSTSTSWVTATNWTPNGVPSDNTIIIIPDATTTTYDPTVPAFHTSGTIAIEDGGIINTSENTELTLNGSSGVWNNQGGTFNAGTSTIIITNSKATIDGTSNFNNITINSGAKLSLTTGSVTGIAGTLTNNGIVDAGLFQSTVNYNGTSQTIIDLNGEITPGYYNLILSGSGTKTMPSTAMNIGGDFTIEGTAIVSVGESLTFLGDLSIGIGSTLATGSYDHTISGNFVNNGTFSASADKTITMNGSFAQSISGTSSINFDNLTINNSLGVTLLSSVNINNVLTLESGTLFTDEITLGINGTISKISGTLEASTLTSVSFGGTDALTLADDLFTSSPILKNVTINQAGGITLGNQSMTVNGILDLQTGTFHIGANMLTIAGSSPTRTSGTIDAVNEGATIVFTNSSALTLPTSIFTGNVNNLTIDGAGGVTASDDITLNGILELASANPSSIKGSLDMGSSTLNMGEFATTTGSGDVIGIVKRQHTFVDEREYDFGNQFTSINFLGVESSPKPTWVSCKIVIGTAPTWRSEAINRYYSFAQSGGTDRMLVKLHYLDSELHDSEMDETQLVFWDAYDPAFGVNNFVKSYPRNKNDIDVDDNWIQLTGPAINYIATSSTSDVKQWGLAYTNVSNHTWTGNGSPSYDGDWSLPGNWNGGVPTKDDDVIIPDPSTLPGDNNGDLAPDGNLLPSITSCAAKTLEIESNATLNASAYDIAIYGDANAWVNNGTFIPGNGTIIFANGSVSNIATITGTTNFNNLNVKANTYIQAATGSIVNIAGEITFTASSILDFTANSNTIEYNGSSQDIINPQGATVTGYNNLIFSGSGTKTLPESSLNVLGNLTINTEIVSTNNTIALSGTVAQVITNPSDLTLNNIIIDNSEGVIMSGGNIFVEGTLTLTDGILSTSTSIIDLGSSGQIVESPLSPSSYVLGNLRATRNIGGSNQTFGGIGLEINETGGSNSTQVTRVTGIQLAGNAPCCNENLSIKRYFDIEPTTNENLDATLKIHYFDWELSLLAEGSLILFKAPLPYVASTWITEDNSTVNVADNSISLTGITDFSRWTAASIDEPLPIGLLSFDGQLIDDGIKLLWSTSSETNNDYFEIEHSRDAVSFYTIGSLNGAGNSSLQLDYTFVDDNPSLGNNYYRLKQVDYNGDFEYHKTVVVNWSYNDIKATSDDINIYPNPYYSGNLTLSLQNLDEYTHIQLSIIGINGNTIYVTSEQIPANKLIYIMPGTIDYLKQGIYFIRVQTDNNMFTKKVIVK